MKKIALTLLCVFITVIPTFAKISFENPGINEKDEVVYTVNYKVTGAQSYRSVFHTQLKSGAAASQKDLITYYPEQMELLSMLGQKILQIRNKYGTARYYASTDSISWVKLLDDIPLASTVTMPYAASPDGRWICYIEKTGIATGRLILESVSTEKKIKLCENILCSYDSVPVKWAPDSSYVLYEKNDGIYFCSPDALHSGVEVEEKHRKIGRGTINSVAWASEKSFVYIDDYIVYKINSRELYTLGLYSGIIGQGTAIGRLPFQFNASRDEFFANSDATGIVLAQEKKNFTYFKTQFSFADYMDILYSKPYTDSRASLADYAVFWNKNGVPILWQLKLPYTSTNVLGTVIMLGENPKTVLEISNSGRPILSPDKSKVAFFSGDTIFVYDINSWAKLSELTGENIVNILWKSSTEIFIGGENTIKEWNVVKNKTNVITLSSAKFAFWDGTESKIISETLDGKQYCYNFKTGRWTSSETKKDPQFDYQNGKFRVFCGTTSNPLYENSLYIRSLSKKVVTKPVYESSAQKMKERQKVALIFDAYDNADGLPKIISSLNKCKIPGTFFVNGEFIRRYPGQTKQIALNGYECASMFFTTTDLTDKSFVIDAEFIARGLGRNEDEFFSCTGKELSLYWHAPYYNANNLIIQAGTDAGYEYINSPHIHSDNVSMIQLENGKSFLNPERLIEEYIDLIKETKGGVIPITVGVSQGGSPHNLWEHIDLLINALLDENFELVTVSQL